MLLADVEQQLTLLGGELLAAASVAAWHRPKGFEPAGLVRVVPTLERGHRVGLGRLGLRRAKPLLRELGQGLGKLAAVELTAGQGPDDLAAKQRNRLGMVLRAEIFHRHTLLAPRIEGARGRAG